jgi:undecaprenyl-diphosphatase
VIGWFVYFLYNKVAFRFKPSNEDIFPLARQQEFSFSSVRYIVITGVLTIVVAFISGKVLLDLM